MFSCEISKIFKPAYFEEHLRTTASKRYLHNPIHATFNSIPSIIPEKIRLLRLSDVFNEYRIFNILFYPILLWLERSQVIGTILSIFLTNSS